MDARRMLDALSAATGRIGAAAARVLGRGAAEPGAVAEGKAPSPDAILDLGRLDEDEATFLVRVMVAAAAAEGVVTAEERARLIEGMRDAGLDPDDAAWLENEMRWPMDIEEIADRVATPEAAARAYAAARLAIEPDTMQERAFLQILAERMDLGDAERARIETAARSG
ncbi:DUF533 domain-containing protein [Salinarimonas sp.]|uniref:DUF533 domain-containing protein n=1 Tax=Salinarimonas sp. TaxID=2766526 RepID=UPI003919733B